MHESKSHKKIALVGEAWGKEEEAAGGRPFIGPAGQHLDIELGAAGIARPACLILNVFNLRPPADDNAVESLCTTKVEAQQLWAETGQPGPYPLPYLSKGNYVKPCYFQHIIALKSALERNRPNVVVPLGNTALWALSIAPPAIRKLRGAVAECALVPGLKMLPTYHPSATMRNWDWTYVSVRDLVKARVESEYPEIRRRHREVWIEPTLDDLECFERRYIRPDSILSYDVETNARFRFIRCIGIAPDPDHSLVLPFSDGRKPNGAYWPTIEDQVVAYTWLRRIAMSHHAKGGQNNLFDIQWMLDMGIPVLHDSHDTMLLHHALYPGMEKGLDFLGSIYLDEVAWKSFRPSGFDTSKSEE